MHENTSVELKRDCPAVQIPIGTAVTLPAGTAVDISQTLGGNYTVQTGAGLFRIAARDADALGIETTSSLMEEVFNKPSGPVNIVDLGLIYDMHIEPLPGGNSKVLVKMTLTAPGCGMGTVIASDAQQKLLYLPGVEDAAVEIVWDPPWHQSMITADGRRILGLE